MGQRNARVGTDCGAVDVRFGTDASWRRETLRPCYNGALTQYARGGLRVDCRVEVVAGLAVVLRSPVHEVGDFGIRAGMSAGPATDDKSLSASRLRFGLVVIAFRDCVGL